MILADTSGLLALLDQGEAEHARCRDVIEHGRGPLLTIDLVLAETEFLVLSRLGRTAERAFVKQVVAGVPRREPVRDTDLARALEILGDYADQGFGVTDASLMAVAERLGAPVLTLDRRHFGPFRDRKGRALVLCP